MTTKNLDHTLGVELLINKFLCLIFYHGLQFCVQFWCSGRQHGVVVNWLVSEGLGAIIGCSTTMVLQSTPLPNFVDEFNEDFIFEKMLYTL